MGKGLTELPLPSGSDTGLAHDVNDNGLVVGVATVDGASRGVLWVVK